MKEATGHTSDAIDKYQITSHEQREMMSNVIAGKHLTEVREVSQPKSNDETSTVDIEHKANVSISQANEPPVTIENSVKTDQIGSMINNIIKEQKGDGKVVIIIQIEITKK